MKLKSLFKGLFTVALLIPYILFTWIIGGERLSELILYNKTMNTRYVGQKMTKGLR